MEQQLARKPFKIKSIDPSMDKQAELAVFTQAKKLSEYIFMITEKSPVKLRWSIVARLQNTSVEIIENLYRANFEKGEERIEFQKRAGVSLRLLDFYAETAFNMQAINMKQMLNVAKYIFETKKLLGGWSKNVK